jgi:RHS repeat-associated protein
LIGPNPDGNFTNTNITVSKPGSPLPAELTKRTIDRVGNVVKVSDPLQHETTYAIDAMDRVYLVTTPSPDGVQSGNTQRTLFDKESRVTEQDEGAVKKTNFTIDALGRTYFQRDTSNQSSTTVFNADDEVAASKDGLGNLTADGYNSDGDNTIVVDARGGVTQKIYNADNLLIALIDPVGNKTTWEYNADGQKTKETDALNHSRTWEYDDAGNVQKYIDKNNHEKDYAYYNNDLLHTETDVADSNVKTYEYNSDNQLTRASDNAGLIKQDYDDLGRPSVRTDVWNNTITKTYDAANRVLTVTDSRGGSMTYTPDNADRVQTKAFTNGTTRLQVDYTYNDRDQVDTATRSNPAAIPPLPSLVGTTVYGYDPAGKTNAITYKDGNAPTPNTVDSFSYLYDPAGNITQESSPLRPTKTYTYDKTNQITSETVAGTPPTTTNYSWDANGNNTAYTTTTNNQLQTDGNWNYGYDFEGNVTQKVSTTNQGTWTYTYNFDNRLITAEHINSQGLVDQHDEFKYDVLGNRIQKSVAFPSATTTKYAYDENGNAWADLDNSGSLTTRRLYNDAVDSLLAKIDSSGNTTWYLTDVLGSVRDLTNGSGAPVGHREYDTFGKLTSDTFPPNSERYGWTGRERDVELDLQYNRARYYDANTGRWISQDPLGFDAGDNNLYRYVNNGPTSTADPSGLQPDQAITGDVIVETLPQSNIPSAKPIKVRLSLNPNTPNFDAKMRVLADAFGRAYVGACATNEVLKDAINDLEKKGFTGDLPFDEEADVKAFASLRPETQYVLNRANNYFGTGTPGKKGDRSFRLSDLKKIEAKFADTISVMQRYDDNKRDPIAFVYNKSLVNEVANTLPFLALPLDVPIIELGPKFFEKGTRQSAVLFHEFTHFWGKMKDFPMTLDRGYLNELADPHKGYTLKGKAVVPTVDDLIWNADSYAGFMTSWLPTQSVVKIWVRR